MGEEGSLFLMFYSPPREHRVGGQTRLYPARREAQSSGVACESHQEMIKPRNTGTKCPQRLPCPLLPQDTRRRGEDKTVGENTATVAPWGWSKQNIPLQEEPKPSRGNPSPFPARDPTRRHLWGHEVCNPTEDVLLAPSLPVCFSLFQEGSPA